MRSVFAIFSRAPNFAAADNDILRRMVEAIPAQAQAEDRKRSLLDQLDEAHSFAVPSHLVDREMASIWRWLKAGHREGAFDVDDVGKTDAELKTEYRVIAERRVRLGLVLKEIARRNKVVVTREDVAFARANGYRGPSSAILEEKIVDFIFGLARSGR
jgi:trigger factor